MNLAGYDALRATVTSWDGDVDVLDVPPAPGEHVRFLTISGGSIGLAAVLNALDKAGLLATGTGPRDVSYRKGPQLKLIGMCKNEMIFEDVRMGNLL